MAYGVLYTTNYMFHVPSRLHVVKHLSKTMSHMYYGLNCILSAVQDIIYYAFFKVYAMYVYKHK